MLSAVSSKHAGVGKGLSTVLAEEWLLARVLPQVHLQVARVGIRHAAVLALEGLVAGVMVAHVDGQIRSPGERRGAYAAVERLLARVGQHVAHQLARLRAGLSALFALKRFVSSVRAHVNFEVTRGHEGRITHLALERLLNDVSTLHVLPEREG